MKAVPERQDRAGSRWDAIPACGRGQYPPHNFGADGFNLIYYYYYLSYWQPLIGNLYWDEMARMNNRDLELWTFAGLLLADRTDLLPEHLLPAPGRRLPGDQLLHLCRGEARGLERTRAAGQRTWCGRCILSWASCGRRRPRTACCCPTRSMRHSAVLSAEALYAYANLLGAHLDVQPTCEEEVLSGYIKNYKTILLWHVEWMRESVVKALEDYIAQGGVVLADSTTTVPIKGAIKLPVDLAMGDKKSKPDVTIRAWAAPASRITCTRTAWPTSAKQSANTPSRGRIARTRR